MHLLEASAVSLNRPHTLDAGVRLLQSQPSFPGSLLRNDTRALQQTLALVDLAVNISKQSHTRDVQAGGFLLSLFYSSTEDL